MFWVVEAVGGPVAVSGPLLQGLGNLFYFASHVRARCVLLLAGCDAQSWQSCRKMLSIGILSAASAERVRCYLNFVTTCSLLSGDVGKST